MDKVSNWALPNSPTFIYRKARSFRDIVVKKVSDRPARTQMFRDRACRKCKACRQVNNTIRGLTSFISMVDNREIEITKFI